MSKRTSLLIILIAVTIAATAQRRLPRNDFNTDTLLVHDPVMAFDGGVYHVFSTGQGLQHATSRDMKRWTVHARPTITNIPKWTHDSVPGFKSHVWAPDIIRYKNRWWLSYSCSTFGKNTSAIGLVSTDRLNEDSINWRDEGPLICSREGRDNWNAIDPNFIIDDDNNPWLVFGSFWDGIQLLRLDSTMHAATPRHLTTIARRYTGGVENPIEAPFIFRHDGWYYLFVSWDYCCRGMKSTYRVVVGRSRKITGPYLDRNGLDMAKGGGTPVFEGDKRKYEAAGHSAAYRFNSQDYFVCHGYNIALGGTSSLVLMPMNWNSDGWPVVSDN